MNLLRALIVAGTALPALAQYSGPAILSRGQVPSGMTATTVTFRPFLELSGVYDSGLAGPGVVDAAGNLASASAVGVELTAGVSGSHKWRHTVLGLDYRGSYRHYNRNTYYDSTDQSILLGLSHQMSRRMMFTLRQSAGIVSRDFGLIGLQQAVPFDPASSYIPTTDFFDNRTMYLSTQADFTYQRTARLSYNVGADYFAAHRRSASLYGTSGESARGDVQYRVGRYTTIGANYGFSRFQFSKGFGNTVIHTATGTYSVRLSRTVELSFYGGVGRTETKYVQTIQLDPVIAAILGRSTGVAVIHNTGLFPNVGGRIARTFHKGVLFATGSRAVNPGNGLFLTSETTSATVGYDYSGFRRWSIGAGATVYDSDANSNVTGNYKSYTASVNASRRIHRFIHGVMRVEARRYDSGDFSHYNRTIYRATIGLGFAPGDLPLRLW